MTLLCPCVVLVCVTPQARFRSPLWATVDEVASYLEEAFETVKSMRVGDSARQHDRANQDVTTYTSLLVLFTAACVLM